MKRSFDIAASGVAILILLPLLALTALLVKLQDGGPIFYRQVRLGKNGKEIHILKFRSMTNRMDRVSGEAGELVGENAEFTWTGRVIRRLKIDELPQLLSVFVGDMSLVGPRPSLPNLRGQFDPNGALRIKVRPGCTGLAQVHGNIYLEWPERWKYDAWYVDHISMLLDLWILLKTVLVVFKGEARFLKSFDDFVANQGDGHNEG